MFTQDFMELNNQYGMWCLPDIPERTVAGKLIVENDYLFLYLWESIFKPVEKLEQIINGRLENHKLLTLVCVELLESYSNYGSHQKLRIKDVFIGKHFANRAAIEFSSVKVNFNCLTNWLNYFPYCLPLNPNRALEYFPFDSAPPLKITIENEVVEIKFDFYTLREQGSFPEKIIINNTAFLVIIPACKKNYIWYEKITLKIQRLLALFIGTAIYNLQCIGRLSENEKSHEYYKEIQIISIFLLEARRKNEKIEHSYMFIRWEDIKENINYYFNNWFHNYQKFHNIINLYMSVIYNKKSYLDDQFCNLIKFIEVYHKKTSVRGKLLDTNYLNAAINEIIFPKKIPQKIIEATKRVLLNKNSLHLKDRINEILGDFSNLIKLAHIDLINDPCFIDRIKDTRNYLTHYDPENETVVNYAQVVSDIHCLRALSTIILFRLIGMDDEMIKAAFGRSLEYRHKPIPQQLNN